MKNIFLYLIAITLTAIFAVTGILYALFRCICSGSFSEYMGKCAIAVNQTGNVYMKHLFNDIMIKQDSYPFGNPNHTISHVLGVNKSSSNLLVMGELLAGLLNWIDEDHVEKAANRAQ